MSEPTTEEETEVNASKEKGSAVKNDIPMKQ